MPNKNKDINKLKFSELITELMEMWLDWMKQDKISHDTNLSYKVRRKAAEECEILINREYTITSQMDKFFE